MEYEGRAQLGDAEPLEVLLRIPDVEHPEWFAHVQEAAELHGEVTVTLLDGGIYNAWRGSALVQNRGGRSVLVGIQPLTPPIGA